MDPITVTCPACGERVTTDGVVCPRCGASIQLEAITARTEAIRATAAAARRPAPRGGTTVNGWGTMLLDYRPRGDGTWDALRWFTIGYIPIAPLRAVHLRPVRDEAMISGRTYHYDLLGECSPPPARVLWIYALVLAGALPVLFAFLRMDTVNRWVGSGPGIFVTLTTIAWAIYVQTRFINADRAYKAAVASDAAGTR